MTGQVSDLLFTKRHQWRVATRFSELPDEAALAGVLNTLYELHLPVLSVERVSAG
jgi:hypothetical protein